MRVGFIGLGNVGAKLTGSLLANGVSLGVLDLDAAAMRPFLDAGLQAWIRRGKPQRPATW